MDNSHKNDAWIEHIQLEKILDQAFLSAKVRQSTCAGLCYPDEAKELRLWLDLHFAKYLQTPSSPVHALFAPHIDFRVNIDIYAKAFSNIRNLRPKKVFLIGTSHYSGMYWPAYENKPFILTTKDFETPLGVVKTDKEMVKTLSEKCPFATTHDVAHRNEHALELHIVLLAYLWQHPFEIVPILVGGLDELLYSDKNPSMDALKHFGDILQSTIEEDDLILISGDLSHIGRKFGDKVAAENIRSASKKNDVDFLHTSAHSSPAELIKLMQSNTDEFRICGFPPMLTYKMAFPNTKGTSLAHAYWDEKGSQSGVSFAAMSFS